MSTNQSSGGPPEPRSALEDFLHDQLAEPRLIPLLFRGFRNLQGMVQPALEAKGHQGMGLPETRLLLSLETDGTRINLLAERTGTSRQFTSRIVHDLALRGYVGVAPEKDDRRASVVVLEPLGRRFLADLNEVKSNLDDALTQQIGAPQMAAFLETLRDLIRHTEPRVP